MRCVGALQCFKIGLLTKQNVPLFLLLCALLLWSVFSTNKNSSEKLNTSDKFSEFLGLPVEGSIVSFPLALKGFVSEIR